MADEALERNPSFFNVLLNLCLILLCRSLYYACIRWPDLYPNTNYAFVILKDEPVDLKLRLLTKIVDIIFLGRISVSVIVIVDNLSMSFVNGYMHSIAVYEL